MRWDSNPRTNIDEILSHARFYGLFYLELLLCGFIQINITDHFATHAVNSRNASFRFLFKINCYIKLIVIIYSTTTY